MQISPLPDDLARPRADRASLIANLATGATLLLLVGGLLTFWLVTLPS